MPQILQAQKHWGSKIHAEYSSALTLLLKHFSHNQHQLNWRPQPQYYSVIEVRVTVRVRVQRTTKPTGLEPLGLQKAY